MAQVNVWLAQVVQNILIPSMRPGKAQEATSSSLLAERQAVIANVVPLLTED